MMEQREPLISVVRQRVLAAFQAMGAGEGCCSESILVKDGLVVGRRFRLGGLNAVWLAEERHISIFNEAGVLIETLPLDNVDVALKTAA
jgi:hypothetical protein